MMIWIGIAVYVAGFAYAVRRVALNQLEESARDKKERRDNWKREFRSSHPDAHKPLVDFDDRMMALMGGFLSGTIWPISLTVSALANSLTPPTIRAENERAELEKLRELCKKHNLPMPEVEK